MSSEGTGILTVSAADISRNFGEWQAKAMSTPVVISHHGRARLVLAALDRFTALDPATGCAPTRSDPQADAKLHAVLNQMRDGFFAFSAEMKIIETNPAAEIYVGFGRDQLIGHDLREVLPMLRESVAWDYVGRVLRTGESVEFKMRSAMHNGPRINLRAFPYDGQGVGLIFKNLGPSEEAEVQLRRLEAVQDDPAMALIRLNPRGGIEAVDAAFIGMTGFAERQLVDLLIVDIVRPEDRTAVMRALNAAVRSAEPRAVRAVVVARDGTERTLKLHFSVAVSEALPEEVAVCVMDMARPGA